MRTRGRRAVLPSSWIIVDHVAELHKAPVGGSGMKVTIDGKSEQRISLTTKGGHHILIVFSGTAPAVYADPDPKKLPAFGA